MNVNNTIVASILQWISDDEKISAMQKSYSVCPYWNWVLCYVPFKLPCSLNSRAYSAHSTWTTLWSFRSFLSKPQSSFILSTITEQWKFSYRMFTYIQNEISFFECIPINFEFTVYSQFKNMCPKSHKIVYFLSKRFITKQIDTGKQNRCSTIPAEWNLDITNNLSHGSACIL